MLTGEQSESVRAMRDEDKDKIAHSNAYHPEIYIKQISK